MATHFAFTIDTEEEWQWGREWPTKALSLSNVQNLPRLQQVCARYGVPPTYFVNHAVLADAEARDTVLGLSQWGRHEIGMHIHPWNTPPVTRNGFVPVRETYLHNLDDATIQAKLASVYNLFRECELTPTSFRGGRYSSGGAIHEFLQSHGFVADSSVVPFTSWQDDGAPDYRHRDGLPVRIAPRRAGDAALWEIPLTLGFTRRPFRFWARCYQTVERSWLRNLRLIGIAERTGLVSRTWLNLEDTSAADLLRFLRTLRRMNLPCICLTVHSSSLMAGKNVYTRTRDDEERIFAALESVLSAIAEDAAFQPATMTEIATQLEDQHHACARNQPAG